MRKRSEQPVNGRRARPSPAAAEARPVPASTSTRGPRAAGARTVVRLGPEHVLARASRRFLNAPGDRCTKCGSEFVTREPAFVHCHYCGAMIRIANASLDAQEIFELRSGLRLAS